MTNTSKKITALTISYITAIGRLMSLKLASDQIIEKITSEEHFQHDYMALVYAIPAIIFFMADKEFTYQHYLGIQQCKSHANGCDDEHDNPHATPVTCIKKTAETAINLLAAACDAGTATWGTKKILDKTQSHNEALIIPLVIIFICTCLGRYYIYDGHNLQHGHGHGHGHGHRHEDNFNCINKSVISKVFIGLTAGLSHGGESYFASIVAAKALLNEFDWPTSHLTYFGGAMFLVTGVKAGLVEADHTNNIRCPNRHDTFSLAASALYTLPALAAIAMLPLSQEQTIILQCVMLLTDTAVGWFVHGQYANDALTKLSDALKKLCEHGNTPTQQAPAKAPLLT